MNSLGTSSKWAHGICFICVAVIALITTGSEPDFINGPINTLSTIGFFSTMYGVLFAIVELLRAKDASNLATDEARSVFNAIAGLITAREIVECQSTVSMAASAIDEGKPIPAATLCHVIKIYSQVFHSEIVDSTSEHRKNRSILESYSFNPNINSKRVSGSSTKSAKRALLSISGHLGQLQGSTKNFSEYKK